MGHVSHNMTRNVATPARPLFRCVAMDRFGSVEVLRIAERPEPALGEEEVLVAVQAAAVNPTDILLRRGLQADLLEGPPPHVPGMEFAGLVLRAGTRVREVAPGERVMGVVDPRRAAGGAQAERIAVPAASVVRVPERLSPVEAAVVPMAGLTALLAVEALDAGVGDPVYISGASGVVGDCAARIAVRRGVEVSCDGRASDDIRLREAGVRCVFARGEAISDPQLSGAFTGAIDAALLGAELVPLLRPGGVLVALRRNAEMPPGVRNRSVSVSRHFLDRERLAEVARLANEAVLVPRVAAVLPFTAVRDAHRMVEAGGLSGRVVLEFPDA